MVVQTAVLAHHVVHHVAADAIQVVIAVRHLPLAPVALIAVVVDAIQDVVEDVRAVAPLTVKEVVVLDVQAVVVHHALEPAKKLQDILYRRMWWLFMYRRLCKHL